MIKVYESLNNLILYHASETKLNNFDLSKSDEIGLHVGTKKAALDRSKGFNKKPHFYQLTINSSAKFIVLNDNVYSWTSLLLLKDLIAVCPNLAKKSYTEYRDLLGDMNIHNRSMFIANMILDAGYSGIKYRNEIEDPGSISYIIVDRNVIDSIEEVKL